MNDVPAATALPTRAQEWLSRDLLRHVVHLKAWDAYAPSIQAHHAAIGADQGLLFLHPTSISPFEAVRYAQTQQVALIDADTPQVAARLVEALPRDATLVLKLVELPDLPTAETDFRLDRVTAFLSYSPRADCRFAVSDQVRASDRLDDALLPLYAQNGYTAQTVRSLFGAGLALSFAVYRDQEPVSVCLAHCNHAAVWQVDALYTVDSARGQGLASELVQTALQALLDAGRIPRFQMNEKNIVSRRLAESLGLQRRLSTGHFIATPR